MNAAAREIHQVNFFNGQLSEMHFSKPLYGHMLLLLAVLMSAFAVIYVTNLHRLSLSQLQAAEQESHQLQLQWGQLLLEQASLATPARVEELATERLHMSLPTTKQTIILRVQ
jgi:cell division protein FtsL